MKNYITLILALSFAISASSSIQAQRAQDSFDTVKSDSYEKSISSAKRLIKAHMKVLNVPGISVAVSKNGKMIWSEGFGYADLEKKVSVTPLTKFRIASVSKTLTTAAIMKLAQDGKLDLDTPIRNYLPSFPEKEYPITVRQLTSHLAGIRHYQSGETINKTEHYNSVSEALSIFKNDSLLFKPGTKYKYSTYGYVLLSAVIEEVSGVNYLDYMQENVFKPLQMNHTIADFTDSLISFRSEFYVEGKNRHSRIQAPYTDNSYKWAGAGYLSTPEDLVRFGNAHLNTNFFNRQSLATLFTRQITTSGDSIDYGIGWKILKDYSGRRVYYHGGNLDSGRAHIVIYPKSQIVIAIMANTGQGIALNDEEVLPFGEVFFKSFQSLSDTEEIDPAGIYTFESNFFNMFDSDNPRQQTGQLKIFRRNGHYEGQISFSLSSSPSPIPVIRFVSPNKAICEAITGSWTHLELEFEKDGFEGTWSFAHDRGGEFMNVSKIK